MSENYYRQRRERSNGLGKAGFVLSIISLALILFCICVPLALVVGIPASLILCGLGFLFSFIGIFKSPRGLAIAGLVLSLVVAGIYYCSAILAIGILATH